jgi:hypothetical protein
MNHTLRVCPTLASKPRKVLSVYFSTPIVLYV